MTKKKDDILSISRKYKSLLIDISSVLESARRSTARTLNKILTITYWEVGRRIVEFEQHGKIRAVYGKNLLVNLSSDLRKNFGRGFSVDNLELMRLFFLAYPVKQISDTVSRKLDLQKSETMFRDLLPNINNSFQLSWSHYVKLIRRVESTEARIFYESEALRNGWSVRQLDRQISTQFYERTMLSKNKSEMLKKGSKPKSEDVVTPEEEIKDPYILEFLNLKDEYSENDLEEALIIHLEKFLLELGGDFAFIGRQKRLRIGDNWFRIDLLFFHRKLKCLVVIDLKLGRFSYSDVGQMNMYLNYAKQHWTNKDENPPVGLIHCAEKDSAVAKYSLEGIINKVLAAEYKLNLPDEKLLAKEVEHKKKLLEERNHKK